MPQVNQNDDQTQRIGLPAAFPSSVLAGSGPQRLLALCGSQKNAPGKRIGSNEEVIAATEANFESKEKSFYKHGIEKLEKRWNACITLEGDYVDE